MYEDSMFFNLEFKIVHETKCVEMSDREFEDFSKGKLFFDYRFEVLISKEELFETFKYELAPRIMDPYEMGIEDNLITNTRGLFNSYLQVDNFFSYEDIVHNENSNELYSFHKISTGTCLIFTRFNVVGGSNAKY